MVLGHPSGFGSCFLLLFLIGLLIRFKLEERTIVSHLFHQWAKKQAFQHPKRLLDKVLSLVAVRKLQVCTWICWANYIIAEEFSSKFKLHSLSLFVYSHMRKLLDTMLCDT